MQPIANVLPVGNAVRDLAVERAADNFPARRVRRPHRTLSVTADAIGPRRVVELDDEA